MPKRSAASRRTTAHPTAHPAVRPAARQYPTWPLVLFTLGLLTAAVALVWGTTRGGAAAAAPTRLAAAEGVAMTVYKSPTCACCEKWVKHMQAAGFAVTVVDRPDVSAVRSEQGVPDALASCHTATVRADGAEYALEGHVPAADVVRLLRERPRVRGIAVPGMPMGSPGMDAGVLARFDVVSFDAAGHRSVYASY